MTLAKDKITTNRGMVKKTFIERGLPYVSELALANVKDLFKIVKWNEENGIRMYRMSSDIFPWCSEYEFTDLPDFDEIKKILENVGEYVNVNDQRLTFHPSPYAVLASDRQDVVQKAIKELRQHGEIMDLMKLERSHYYPINIHINTTKPSKEDAASRFCQQYHTLPECVKTRLVLEVDDKKSQYNAQDLYDLVFKKIGVPLTFDYLHNKCNPHPDLTEEQALSLCLSTWSPDIPAITHYSESRKIYEDSSSREVAHSDWIWGNVETYDLDFDIEFEVKMKDLALLRYINSKKIL